MPKPQESDQNQSTGSESLKPFALSALVELVGIQGIAEEDADTFTKKTNEFRSCFDKLLSQSRYKGKLGNKMWLDRCYVWSDSASHLLFFLREFRSKLLFGSFPAFSRAVVLEGCPVLNDKKESFSETAAILAESLLSFKAVGVRIDMAVRDRYLAELTESKDHLAASSIDIPAERLVFQNCYLTARGSQKQIVPFWDLAWMQPQGTFQIDFEKCFKELRDTVTRSNNSSGYFTSLLINISRNIMPHSTTPENPENESRPLATTFRICRAKATAPLVQDCLSSYFFHLSSNDMLEEIKTMPGGPLALLAIVDRAHSTDSRANGMASNATDPEKVIADCKKYASAFRDHIEGWIYTFPGVTKWLDLDHGSGVAPAYILSGKSRGKFRKEQAIETARPKKGKGQ